MQRTESNENSIFIELAKEIARKAHVGQTDKAGVDYFKGHLTSVASLGNTWQEKVVGFLHDVAEDTPMTEMEVMRLLQKEANLQAADAREIEEALRLLNNRNYIDREAYLQGITKSSLALRVKLNDLTNNLDLTRIANPTNKDLERIERYEKEIKQLKAHLDGVGKSPDDFMVDLRPETVMLREQYTELKKEFSELFMQKQDMQSHKEPLLTAVYLQKVGYKEYDLYRTNMELSKLKHRFALLQAYVKQNEAIDLAEVDQKITESFSEYQEKIGMESEQLAVARDFLNGSFPSSEETKRINDIYCLVVSRLHPDVNTHVTDDMKELFLRAQAAFERSDLSLLLQILQLLGDENAAIEASLPDLQEMVSKMEESVHALKQQIEQLNQEFPFDHEKNLHNEEWVKAECDKLDKEEETLTKVMEKYQNQIALLEEWKPA